MAKFIKVEAKNGRTMYFKDGKMVPKTLVPQAVQNADAGLEIVLADQPKQVKEPENCLVCGEPGTHEKYLSGVNFKLCNDHYGVTTTGKLAQILREQN